MGTRRLSILETRLNINTWYIIWLFTETYYFPSLIYTISYSISVLFTYNISYFLYSKYFSLDHIEKMEFKKQKTCTEQFLSHHCVYQIHQRTIFLLNSAFFEINSIFYEISFVQHLSIDSQVCIWEKVTKKILNKFISETITTD